MLEHRIIRKCSVYGGGNIGKSDRQHVAKEQL